MSDQTLEEYLDKYSVKQFISNLTEVLCKEQPKDLVSFTIDYLTKNPDFHPLDIVKASDSEDNEEKKDSDDSEDEDYKNSVLQFQQSQGRPKDEDTSTEIDTNTSEKIRNTYIYQVRRKAFSSESINMDDIQNYKPAKVEKTTEERQRLAQALSKNALFAHFEKDDLEVLYDAMFRVVCQKGDIIMRQGDVGDNFYIIDSGTCEIFVKFDVEKPEVMVKVCKDGDSFGELALMYGTPRAATIRAASDVKLWAIDRMSYRKIVMGRTMNKRELYEGFLKNVPLLQSMNDYERLTIADALLSQEFKVGDDIIRQGDFGQAFFIITDGECQVWKSVDGVRVDLIVLKKGDYFGELALLFDQPRAATVTALSPVKVISLDAKSFKLLLGPVDEILKRNTTNYEFYMKKQVKN